MGCPQRGSWPGIGIHCPVSRAAKGSGPMSGCGSQEHSAAAAEARELNVKGGLVRDWDWAPWDMFQEKEGWDRSVYGTRFWHSGNTAVVRVNGQPGGQPARPRVSPTRALLGTREATPFREATAPSRKARIGQYHSRVHLHLHLQLHLRLCLHLLRVFPTWLPCIHLLPN